MQFNPSEFEKVRTVEAAVQERLDRIKSEGNIEAGIVAIALARCINTILAQYGPEARQQLAAPICDFIEKPQVDRDLAQNLIHPVESNLISTATRGLKGSLKRH